jgi:diphosphomevalonate decarboxylase
VKAIAHPNIALVKYWGKAQRDGNVAAVPSISITLGGMTTTTEVRWGQAADSLLLNGGAADLGDFMNAVRRATARQDRAHVVSDNDFPTASGLASSASGFAALTVAAVGDAMPLDTLAQLARRGSGSAPRSLLGGYVELSCDGTMRTLCRAAEWPLAVWVAMTDTGAKALSSRSAMQASVRSPYYRGWIDSHAADMDAARDAILRRDLRSLGQVAEHSCLKMHGLMLSNLPPALYWNPGTLAVLQTVRALRDDGADAFFTIDAGPQVKVLCDLAQADAVGDALARVQGVVALRRCDVTDEGARCVA